MVNHALLKNDTYTKPIVAAVNGDCIGGGVELLLSTDIRAAAPKARFGLPEVKWSIYPFGGAAIKLINQIGHVHAMDLLLTARLIDAARGGDARSGQPGGADGRADGLGDRDGRDDRRATARAPVQAVKRQISATVAEHAQGARDARAGTRRCGARRPAFRGRRRGVPREAAAEL